MPYAVWASAWLVCLQVAGVCLGLLGVAGGSSACRGYGVQADAGRDRGVQGFHRAGDGDGGQGVAVLAGQAAQPLAFGAQDHHQRVGLEARLAHGGVACAVQADRVVAAFLESLDGLGQVDHAGHGQVGGGSGGDLPGRGCDGGAAPFGQDHPRGAEGRSGSDHGPEVLRVGDPVQGDEQGAGGDPGRLVGPFQGGRVLLGPVGQALQGGVLVGPHLEGHALVAAGPGDAVHLQAVGLQQVEPLLPGQADDLPGPVVVFHPGGQVELAGRHARAQGLQDRVAADDQVVGVGGEPVGPAAGRQPWVGRLPAAGRLPGLVGLVVDAVLGPGGGPPAAQLVAVLAARTLGRALLVSHASSVKAGKNQQNILSSFMLIDAAPDNQRFRGGCSIHVLSNAWQLPFCSSLVITYGEELCWVPIPTQTVFLRLVWLIHTPLKCGLWPNTNLIWLCHLGDESLGKQNSYSKPPPPEEIHGV